MNRLKTKASQFFKNYPTEDEKVAIAASNQHADFGAGIERTLKKKPSRFFRKQYDKALPSSPYNPPSEGPPPLLPNHHDRSERADTMVDDLTKATSTETSKPLPSPPASTSSASSGSRMKTDGENCDAARKTKPAGPTLRTRPSFASLRKSGSRIFRSNAGDDGPPPPPMPQIPIDTPTPKPRRPNLRPFESTRSTRSSLTSKARAISISRPLSVQAQLPPSFDPYKVPFTKPTGPPLPRPARPGSVDLDLIAMSRDGGTRAVLHTPARTRTLTTSTTSSRSPLSRVASSEAYSRLGLPSPHSSASSPRSPIFDFPLAANFPLNPSMPLPFRDSDGSVKGYGRFSAWVLARRGYSSGGYDGVEEADREIGPIEMYCESKCADWVLERRVSGGLGQRGMMFRDRWGGWHLVKDI